MDWISTTKKMPDQGVDVLMFDGVKIRIGYWDKVSSNFGNWYDSSNDYIIGFVREWMPLPNPPKEK